MYYCAAVAIVRDGVVLRRTLFIPLLSPEFSVCGLGRCPFDASGFRHLQRRLLPRPVLEGARADGLSVGTSAWAEDAPPFPEDGTEAAEAAEAVGEAAAAPAKSRGGRRK